MKQSLLLSGILFFASIEALSCSCSPRRSLADDLKSFDVVYLGKVLEIGSGDKVDRNYLVTTQVLHNFKALQEQHEVLIQTSQDESACGYEFDLNQEYLIFGSVDSNGRLSTHRCSRNAPLERAREDIEELRRLVGETALR